MSMESQLRDLATRIAAELKTKSNVGHTHWVILNATDPVPADLPEGTLILRRA